MYLTFVFTCVFHTPRIHYATRAFWDCPFPHFFTGGLAAAGLVAAASLDFLAAGSSGEDEELLLAAAAAAPSAFRTERGNLVYLLSGWLPVLIGSCPCHPSPC